MKIAGGIGNQSSSLSEIISAIRPCHHSLVHAPHGVLSIMVDYTLADPTMIVMLCRMNEIQGVDITLGTDAPSIDFAPVASLPELCVPDIHVTFQICQVGAFMFLVTSSDMYDVTFDNK